MSRRSRSSASALEGFVALFQIAVSIAAIPANIQQAQRRIDAANMKIRLDAERIRESTQKQAIATEEAKVRSNKVVLSDLDIEIKKLQLLKLQRELEAAGAFAPTFAPTDYSTEG